MADTVQIPLERYEELLGAEIRIHIICEIIAQNGVIGVIPLLQILGDYSLAEKIKKEVNEKYEGMPDMDNDM